MATTFDQRTGEMQFAVTSFSTRTGHQRVLCYGGQEAVERTANADKTDQNAEKGTGTLGQSDRGDRRFKEIREMHKYKRFRIQFFSVFDSDSTDTLFVPWLTCMGKFTSVQPFSISCLNIYF